jgi:hypothetical protein
LDQEIEGLYAILLGLMRFKRLIYSTVIRNETATLKAQLKETQASLNALKSTPSMASLGDSVQGLESEIWKLEAALEGLRNSKTKQVDPGKKAAAEADYRRIELALGVRQKQFKEFWGVICDSYPGDFSALWVSYISLCLDPTACGLLSTKDLFTP